MLTTYIPFNLKSIMDNLVANKKYDIEYYMNLHLIEYCETNGYDSERLKEYTADIPLIRSVLGRFASTIKADNILEMAKDIDILQAETFLDFVYKYKIYTRLSWDIFLDLCVELALKHSIFEYKAIVLQYASELEKLIEEDIALIEMLISDEFEYGFGKQTKRYFPPELSPEKKEKLAQKYINGEKVHPNYLKLICNSRGTDNFRVSDETRVMAKKRYRKEMDAVKDNSVNIEHVYKITFKSRPNYDIKASFDGKIEHYEYSVEWIKDNSDFPTLLNNFVYLFNFCDLHFRMNFVSLVREEGVFESIFGVRGKKDYATSMNFNMKNMRYTLQMRGYCEELRRQGVEIQDVFKWFFEEYLNEEFGAEGFVYTTPSKETTYLEKCILLSCAVDSVLKQFKMYCLTGCIDRELFEISSNHIVFSEVKGFVGEKYAYANNADIDREIFYIFSDQSNLSFIDKTKNKYTELHTMLQKEDIQLEDFHEFQRKDIEWLVERGSIILDNGCLRLDKAKFAILKSLFNGEVLCCSYIGEYKKALDELVESGDVVIESSLFSKKEQEYLDYMLNNSEYGNGPALRNNYVHGTHSLNPKIHESDYYELLKIMVMIIIKINEEFCLKYPEDKRVKKKR